MDDEDDDNAPVQAGTAPKAGSMDDVLLQSMGVRPGTKEHRSRSRSEYSGGPTKYKQCWNLLPQIGQPLGMMQL
jgi:hypothetical protein